MCWQESTKPRCSDASIIYFTQESPYIIHIWFRHRSEELRPETDSVSCDLLHIPAYVRYTVTPLHMMFSDLERNIISHS